MEGTPQYDKWFKAARENYLAKRALGVFQLMPRAPGQKIIKTRFVFTHKFDDVTGCLKDEDGYRGRLVGCGYSQVPDLHFQRTYTATTKMTGIRLFAARVAQEGRPLRPDAVRVVPESTIPPSS